MARVTRSSYLGKNPFGDKPGQDEGLEPEHISLLHSLQDHYHTYVRVYYTRILSKELRANLVEMEVRHKKDRAAAIKNVSRGHHTVDNTKRVCSWFYLSQPAYMN